MRNAALGILIFASASVISFIIPVFVQFKIYKATKNKGYLFTWFNNKKYNTSSS